MRRSAVAQVAFALGVLFVVRLPALTRAEPKSPVLVVSTSGAVLDSVYEGLPAEPSRVALMDSQQPGAMMARIFKPTPPEPGGCDYCGYIPEIYGCYCEGRTPTLCRYDGSLQLCGEQEFPDPCGCAFDYRCGSCGS